MIKKWEFDPSSPPNPLISSQRCDFTKIRVVLSVYVGRFFFVSNTIRRWTDVLSRLVGYCSSGGMMDLQQDASKNHQQRIVSSTSECEQFLSSFLGVGLVSSFV